MTSATVRALARRGDDRALHLVLSEHIRQVLDGSEQVLVLLPRTELHGHAADHLGVETGISRELSLEHGGRGGVADHQDALRGGCAHHDEAGGGSGRNQHTREHSPEQERVRAARELERPPSLDHEREDRSHGHERRGLVERGLEQDELITVVEPGHLGHQRVQRDQDGHPEREPGVGEHRDQQKRACHGDRVRREQREPPDRLAPACTQREVHLFERHVRARDCEKRSVALAHSDIQGGETSRRYSLLRVARPKRTLVCTLRRKSQS